MDTFSCNEKHSIGFVLLSFLIWRAKNELTDDTMIVLEFKYSDEHYADDMTVLTAQNFLINAVLNQCAPIRDIDPRDLP